MAIITLTTDFGLKDHFVGALKGTIYKELPDAKIVDISHHISPFNIHECAYVLENSYRSFPEGSIHIVGVDAEPTPENKHLALFIDGHYFIVANNGIIGLITSERRPEKVVEINIPNPAKQISRPRLKFPYPYPPDLIRLKTLIFATLKILFFCCDFVIVILT